MSVRSIASASVIVCVAGMSTSAALAQITIPTVPIGNPGNDADAKVMNDGTSGYGSVPYLYNIGTTEVTIAQYAAFLNAVAATDANSLYSTSMAGSSCGITRAGSSGSYTYSATSGRANYPVNWVNFWDAARFANWLHNGQPTGPQNNSTTEDGAYTITPGGISGNTVTRNFGWKWAVANENEWYKAAYHQPAIRGGPEDDYWQYPTASDTISTTQANYYDAVGQTTLVGSYPLNFYGTADMGGNVNEWNDGIFSGSHRGVRGGTYCCSGDYLRFDDRYHSPSTYESPGLGFRVVSSHIAFCLADFTNDGFVNGDDYDAFATLFDIADIGADVNGDTFVNGDDFDTFASHFEAGC